jgi:flagellar hook-associated protein 2
VGTISSPGLGSGLDVSSIVSQLVSIEKQPIGLLQKTATKLQSQLSSWGQIQSALSGLRDASSALNLPSTWTPTTATSSDSSAVTVSTTATAPTGAYSVNVLNLASAQSVSSATYANSATTVGQGSIHIQLGKWSEDLSAFTQSDTPAVDVSIGPGEDTLTSIRDKINAAGAGVTASIVTDTTGSRLVLRGESGAANGFQISVTDSTDGDASDANGLSALAYDPASGISQMTRTQAADDARAQINGLTVTSENNTITSIEGLTLTLGKPTNMAISVSVNRDTAAIEKSVTNFASAYSNLIGLVKAQTKYDSGTQTAATLQGDGSALSLERQFRALVGSSSGASSVFQTLSSVGLAVQSNGSLDVDSSTLQSAIKGNLSELKKLFTNIDSQDSSKNGVAQRFRSLGDQVLGADGLLSARKTGIQSSLTRNTKHQDELQSRAALYETRLRAQYTSLDTQLSKLNSLSSYVTQQLAMLNKTR